MGIDAEILIRNVKRDTVTDEWLKETSWRMCDSIGANKFWFHGNDSAIIRSSHYEGDGEMQDGRLYIQDGPAIAAKPDECLLEIRLRSRYYGIGYERGDLLTICAIAEWWETNFRTCEVWYGGDSSGVVARLFSDIERKNLREHMYSNSGRDYFKQSFESGTLRKSPPACPKCPDGRYRGAQRGFGQNYSSWHCGGCGLNQESHQTDDLLTPEQRRLLIGDADA